VIPQREFLDFRKSLREKNKYRYRGSRQERKERLNIIWLLSKELGSNDPNNVCTYE
jgi:hypothetical protein